MMNDNAVMDDNTVIAWSLINDVSMLCALIFVLVHSCFAITKARKVGPISGVKVIFCILIGGSALFHLSSIIEIFHKSLMDDVIKTCVVITSWVSTWFLVKALHHVSVYGSPLHWKQQLEEERIRKVLLLQEIDQLQGTIEELKGGEKN